MRTPVSLPKAPYDFTVHSGSGLKAVARQLAADGVLPEGETFWILGRLSGKAHDSARKQSRQRPGDDR